ncbi:putative protease Do-like 14 isoform X2 [Diospyros lotus]|uniref:putative protease Do-like 14 isoform X2 n=1 Tax=Diospyros lotus TaxID=55363 RepID=UPI0022513CCC|nr:putative protease Do-like 14 isoform X2 [Diospyros lotus]
MRQFLRQARFSDAYSLLRLLSLAAAGSGALYLNRDADAKTTASVVTATAPLRYLLLLERPIAKDSMIPCRSVVDPDWSSYGGIGLFLSRIGYVAPEGVNKGSSEVSDGSNSIAAAVAKVLPAIVLISVPKKMDNKSCTSIGSGTIVDADGTILTCAHLVVDFQGRKVVSEDKVDVTLQDGQTFVGTVLNADLHSDIAIVKINSKTPFPAAKLGSSCKLHPGESVVALGNPHFLRNTITAGIVSCVDRKSSEIGLGGMLREYIQIDCAVNPGNSGGPLINLDGEIVGVNIMGRKSAAGLNFAVPSDTVSKIVEQFKKNGRVLRPWLGLKMLDLNKMIIVQLKRRHATFPSIKKGVLVLMVSPGSPADRAGMRPGDIVIEFHGKPVGSITEIVELMDDKVGIPLKVVVKREKGTSVTLTVIPEEVNPEL